MSLPLADVRVVAVEQYGAGPWGTLQLADLGADVIKIEDPRVGGDVGRYVPPFAQGEDSLFFETFNRNKRSISLDLKAPQGRAAFEKLVGVSDVVFSNLRGDQPARLGLTFEQLRHLNPRIVCCSLSGFGMTGPRAAEGAYDYTVQGLAGWASLTGEPAGPPGKSALSLVDFSGGYVAAIAMLSGVLRARRDGVGCDCDLSLLETALAELTYIGTWQASRGYTPERSGTAHASMVPFQTFAAQDGSIVIACPKQGLWVRLCEALGRPEWSDDKRFLGLRRATRPSRRARRAHRAATRDTTRAGVGRRAEGGRRAVLGRQLRRAGARRSSGRGARRDHGLHAPGARPGAAGRLTAPDVRRGAADGSRSASRRAHRDRAARALRLRRPGDRTPAGGGSMSAPPPAPDEWRGRFFEDFEVGQRFRSRFGRTITETDNVWFTALTHNTNPVHFDAEFAAATRFGQRLVNSCFTLSLVVGLSVADTSENATANLEWHTVRLPSPVFHGDTIWVESEVLAARRSTSRPTVGIVEIRTRGINQRAEVVCEFRRSFMVYSRDAPEAESRFPSTDAAWGV